MEKELEVGTTFSETGGRGVEPLPSIAYRLYQAYEAYYPTGITYEEFWLLDADLAQCRWRGYVKSIETKDWDMWQNGIYTLRAFHQSKEAPYPRYPLSHGNVEEDGTKAHYELNQAKMMSFANQFNEYMENKGECDNCNTDE